MFQPPGIHGEYQPLTILEEIAAFYVKQLLKNSDEEEMFLGGWSMGSVLAYEMACQLQEKGRSVSGLILLDSYLQEHLEDFTKLIFETGGPKDLLSKMDQLSEWDIFMYLLKETYGDDINENELSDWFSKKEKKANKVAVRRSGNQPIADQLNEAENRRQSHRSIEIRNNRVFYSLPTLLTIVHLC